MTKTDLIFWISVIVIWDLRILVLGIFSIKELNRIDIGFRSCLRRLELICPSKAHRFLINHTLR
jgi:hypothetical protein